MRSWAEMAEDEQAKPAEEAALETSQPAAIAVEPAPIVEPVVEPVVPEAVHLPVPATPAEPPNKLHEWGAALGIMMFLALVLWIFLSFLRNMSY